MSEQGSVEDLIKKIEDFEKTIKALQDNVAVLKQKLAEKQAKYGPDMNQWPKDK
jgi:prefoldin subunit 5